jgi:hypothetical protein
MALDDYAAFGDSVMEYSKSSLQANYDDLKQIR